MGLIRIIKMIRSYKLNYRRKKKPTRENDHFGVRLWEQGGGGGGGIAVSRNDNNR